MLIDCSQTSKKNGVTMSDMLKLQGKQGWGNYSGSRKMQAIGNFNTKMPSA